MMYYNCSPFGSELWCINKKECNNNNKYYYHTQYFYLISYNCSFFSTLSITVLTVITTNITLSVNKQISNKASLDIEVNNIQHTAVRKNTSSEHMLFIVNKFKEYTKVYVIRYKSGKNR